MTTKTTSHSGRLAITRRAMIAGIALVSAYSVIAQTNGRTANVDWPVYGGNAMGQRHSVLTQINRKNVSQLQLAWRFDAGTEGGLQTSPIVIGRTIFAYTPDQHPIALDGATGKLLWKFDPGDTSGQPARGLTYCVERRAKGTPLWG